MTPWTVIANVPINTFPKGPHNLTVTEPLELVVSIIVREIVDNMAWTRRNGYLSNPLVLVKFKNIVALPVILTQHSMYLVLWVKHRLITSRFYVTWMPFIAEP